MKVYHFNFKLLETKKIRNTYQFFQYSLFIDALQAEGITDYIKGYCHKLQRYYVIVF